MSKILRYLSFVLAVGITALCISFLICCLLLAGPFSDRLALNEQILPLLMCLPVSVLLLYTLLHLHQISFDNGHVRTGELDVLLTKKTSFINRTLPTGRIVRAGQSQREPAKEIQDELERLVEIKHEHVWLPPSMNAEENQP